MSDSGDHLSQSNGSSVEEVMIQNQLGKITFLYGGRVKTLDYVVNQNPTNVQYTFYYFHSTINFSDRIQLMKRKEDS